jgi:hypothetical protein
MEISIRHAAGIFALAFFTLASTAAAQVGETGKLRLTGGVNTVDGVAGGGLTPWAVIGSNATADQVGAAPFGTVVKSKDYQLGTAGAAIGIRDRLEVSFARQDFNTMATGTALGLPNLHLKPRSLTSQGSERRARELHSRRASASELRRTPYIR